MSGRTRVLRAVLAATLVAAPLIAVTGLDVAPATAAGEIGAFVAPAAPVNVTAEALNGAARVSFELPVDSEPAISFEVTPSIGGAPVSGPASPIVVSGLTNGVAVSFTVTATNDTGTSAPSAPSNEVTPTPVPTTTPVINAPVAEATVSGVVHIAAQSLAPAVRFTAAGVDLGAPVEVALGFVDADWPSWGFGNGAQTISAYDCGTTDPATCSATPVSVSVTLANDAPVVTAPTLNLLTSGTMPMRATAPGGGIELEIDGARKAFDATSPYAQTTSLAGLVDGNHIARAQACDLTGTRCDGPVSAEVLFRVKSLHPTITSSAPSPFSPNGDGVKDDVTVNLTLPDPQTANWRVLNDAGDTVRGPISLGPLSTGAHPFNWNGKNAAGDFVPNGTYRIVVATTKQGTAVLLRGSVETSVVVDRTAPTLTNVTGNGGTFYPGGGGAPAKFTAGATLAEQVTLTMTVRKPSGALVRQPFGTRGPGVATIQWTGKNTLDQWAPSGAYNWWLKATDAAGNSRTVGKFTATMVRYASRTTTLTLGGARTPASAPTSPRAATSAGSTRTSRPGSGCSTNARRAV